MIIDRLSMFGEKEAVTTSAFSMHILDLLAHGDDIQRELTVWVRVDETVTSSTENSTVTFELYTAASTSGGSLESPTKIWSSAAINKAALVAKTYPVKIPLPPGVQRYLQLKYVVSATLTAGAFDAGLGWGVDLP